MLDLYKHHIVSYACISKLHPGMDGREPRSYGVRSSAVGSPFPFVKAILAN